MVEPRDDERFRAAVHLENRAQMLCTFTDDDREAVAASAEKRPPDYKNR